MLTSDFDEFRGICDDFCLMYKWKCRYFREIDCFDDNLMGEMLVLSRFIGYLRVRT